MCVCVCVRACAYARICVYGWVASLAWSFYSLPFPLPWDDKDKACWKQKPRVKTNHWCLRQNPLGKRIFWSSKELPGRFWQDNRFHGEEGERLLHFRAQMQYWFGLDMIWLYEFLSALTLQKCSVPVWTECAFSFVWKLTGCAHDSAKHCSLGLIKSSANWWSPFLRGGIPWS